jgi:hypothetical protein
MLRVTMVQHVNVQITDRQRTREWYEKVLGATFRCVDMVDSSPEALVFNRTVTLRDTWARIEKAQQGGQRKGSVRG